MMIIYLVVESDERRLLSLCIEFVFDRRVNIRLRLVTNNQHREFAAVNKLFNQRTAPIVDDGGNACTKLAD